MTDGGLIATYLLILMYGPSFSVAAEPRSDLQQCVSEARSRIGEKEKVLMWDDMNGSNPVPKVVIAFCVEGAGAVPE